MRLRPRRQYVVLITVDFPPRRTYTVMSLHWSLHGAQSETLRLWARKGRPFPNPYVAAHREDGQQPGRRYYQ